MQFMTLCDRIADFPPQSKLLYVYESKIHSELDKSRFIDFIT